ncbi:unnamed protein product [Prunus armeniaca]
MGRKGQSTASKEVAEIAEAKLDAQHELWDSQIQEVQATVTAIAVQQAAVQTNMTEVQQTLKFELSAFGTHHTSSGPLPQQQSTVVMPSTTTMGFPGGPRLNMAFTAPNHPI